MIYLVIVAHPDDEILGCGGSMAKWTKKGNEVHALIMTEGIKSRYQKSGHSLYKKKISELKKSAKIASEIIELKSLEMLDYPDNRLDSIELLDLIKPIENKIDNIKPDVVVTHNSSDLNLDHQLVHRAVFTACRPQPSISVKKILCFEVPSSTEWQSPTLSNSFMPNWFENITETLDRKIMALNAYSSEMRDWPHTRSIEAVEYLAKWRGATVGVDSAEAFILLRHIVN